MSWGTHTIIIIFIIIIIIRITKCPLNSGPQVKRNSFIYPTPLSRGSAEINIKSFKSPVAQVSRLVIPSDRFAQSTHHINFWQGKGQNQTFSTEIKMASRSAIETWPGFETVSKQWLAHNSIKTSLDSYRVLSHRVKKSFAGKVQFPPLNNNTSPHTYLTLHC